MQARRKIAVAGATGRLGRHVVDVLKNEGHDVVGMSRSSGVDVVSGDGLRVWDLYRRGSPPRVGYDPGRYWKGPEDPRFAMLCLDPWRVQVVRGADLRSRIWRAET